MPSLNRSADLALTVFLAPLATGRRVLWLGDPASGGPDRLAAHADTVRVLDTSGRARRRRQGAARVSPYRPGPLDFDRGAFEIVVIPDVAAVDSFHGRLDELAEMLGDGIVVAGTSTRRDDAAIELSQSLLGSFREVRLLGQARFGGLALADLSADGVDDVVVDGSLLGDETEAIERVYGIAADELPRLAAYMVVQVAAGAEDVTSVDQKTPREGLEDALANRSREAEALRDALERAESRLEQVQARLVSTEGELSEARAGLTGVGLEGDDDVVQLETKLQASAQQVRTLHAELESRAVLVRDLVEELREWQTGRRGERGPEFLLDSEAARTDAELAADELRARLIEIEETFDVERARLTGRVRGLEARMAELGELRATAEARLAVRTMDGEDASKERRRLQAEIGQLRDQLEIALIKARGAPPRESVGNGGAAREAELVASEQRLSARVGTLSGQLMASREATIKATEERDRARAETLRLTAQLSNLETRTEGLRIGYEMRIAMMGADAEAAVASSGSATGSDEAIERELERLSGELDGLRGERDGLRLRLEDREAALAAAQTRRVSRPPPPADDRSEELASRITALQASSEAETARMAELTAALVSREALITRLQMDLAEEEHSSKLYDDQLKRSREECIRLREALIGASNAVDARERAEEEAETLRRQLVESQHKLVSKGTQEQSPAQIEESKARIDEAQSRIDEAQSRIAELEAALEAAGTRMNAERGQLEEDLRGLRRERDQARGEVLDRVTDLQTALGALREARSMLDAWRVDEPARAASEITAVGLDAPDDAASLKRDLDNKDTLLRSLTAQLEERDDRIRALQRRVAQRGDAGPDDDVRHRVMELEERAIRLKEELEHERDARSGLQRELDAAARRPDADAELKSLRRDAAERAAALEEASSRAQVFERDVESLQQVVRETRNALEGLLQDAQPAIAERIGVLLSLLGGF